jgi:uncharacterized RDD family membrane protein YckC
MKSIDIRTTQNVTISYELAAVRDRILAYVVDTLIKLLYYTITVLLAIYMMDEMHEYEEDFMIIFGLLVIAPPIAFYSLFFENVMNGQTPGKRLLKIRVVKLNGKQPEFYDYVLRWSFRLVDLVLSGGVLASILVSSSDHSQRLGDMVSNTTVVRVRDRSPISLADILKIESLSSYEPKYVAIRNFPERDIMLIKNALGRYMSISNTAHMEVLQELADSMAARLKVEERPADVIVFLRTLIKDYVVLTR